MDESRENAADTMRSLDVDFYVCPNTGDLVYRWSDERMVLVSSADARVLRWFHHGQPDEERVDQALIEAAAVGLFSERVGLPLLPWQQRYLDHTFITKKAES